MNIDNVVHRLVRLGLCQRKEDNTVVVNYYSGMRYMAERDERLEKVSMKELVNRLQGLGINARLSIEV